MASMPETRYAKSGDIHIAYQVMGSGPFDLVLVPGFATHLELQLEEPRTARFLERLSSFCRLIRFDKRGTGLSDRVAGIAMLEDRMDDVRAVMDAVGSDRAALLGISEGGADEHPFRGHVSEPGQCPNPICVNGPCTLGIRQPVGQEARGA